MISVPELSLVVLVGVSGSGKSTFAARHFKPTQVISSDFCRGLVSDDENDQSATPDAFDLLHHIVGVRLSRGLLTVVDATNVQWEARRQLIDLAKSQDVLVDAYPEEEFWQDLLKVTGGATETRGSAETVLAASQAVESAAANLRDEVEGFLQKVAV